MKDELTDKNISTYDDSYSTCPWNVMLNRDFFAEGPEKFSEDKFHVCQIVDNEFKCVQMTGEGRRHVSHVEQMKIIFVRIMMLAVPNINKSKIIFLTTSP